MAHDLFAPWHGLNENWKPITTREAMELARCSFRVEFVPVRVVCQNTLAFALPPRPSRWERFKAWLSDTVERIERAED